MPDMTEEELAEYQSRWPGSAATEAEASSTLGDINGAPDIAGRIPKAQPYELMDNGKTPPTSDSEAEESFQVPNNFSHPLSNYEPPVGGGTSLAAEDVASSCIEALGKVDLDRDRIPAIVAVGTISSNLAIARAIREHTMAISMPPVMYVVDGKTGKTRRADAGE